MHLLQQYLSLPNVQYLEGGTLSFTLAGPVQDTDNHTLHDPMRPVEILRTIHSFDPCIACAVYLTDEDGEGPLDIKIC